MFSNSPFAGIPTVKLICGLGLCTVGGVMLYVYFKNGDDDEEANNSGKGQQQNGPISNGNSKQQVKPAASPKPVKPPKMVTFKVVVDNQNIPILMGRSGENIKMLEERTKTKIEFRDKNNKQKYCEISGEEENVKQARNCIQHDIERVPVIKEVIKVPQYCMGKVIGRCGEELTEICRQSNAKITIDPGEHPQSDDNDFRSIQIVGNAQQVKHARKLIEDKVAEEEKLRRLLELAEQNRVPRRSPTNSVNSSMYSSQTSLNSHMPLREKMLASKDKPMEVYVSAIATPTKFWVQILGKQTAKLNDLVDEMTAYYNVPDSRKLHQLDVSQLYIGQIVAAVFKYDSKWYRAEIVNILPNLNNPKDVQIDLYFVDYGDSDYVKPDSIFELRTDFLTLRFQAVECYLAHIKSTSAEDPVYWERSSTEVFEELTQVARWKKLNLRVVTYMERPKSENSTELVSVPGVELYDVVDNTEVNLAHLLIMNGYALPLEEAYTLHQRSASRERVSSPGSLTPTLTQSQSPSPSPMATSTNDEDAKLMEQMKFLPAASKTQQNGTGYTGVADILNSERRQHNGMMNWNG